MTNSNRPFIQTAKVKHGREEENMFQRKRFFFYYVGFFAPRESFWTITPGSNMLFYFKTHCKSSKLKIYPCLSWKILYCVLSRKSKKINICIRQCSIWIHISGVDKRVTAAVSHPLAFWLLFNTLGEVRKVSFVKLRQGRLCKSEHLVKDNSLANFWPHVFSKSLGQQRSASW